jgi:hypothetical protein
MVLGKWDESEGKIKDPALLQTMPTEQGGVQMLLLPYGYPFDQEITGEISTDHVLYIYKNIPEDLKNKYTEASSNLTISNASQLSNLDKMAGGQGGNASNLSNLLRK